MQKTLHSYLPISCICSYRLHFDGNNGYNRFIITTSDGIKYYFGASEDVMSRRVNVTNPGPYVSNTNAWYLTNVIHQYGDTINLEYDTISYSYVASKGETVTVLDPPGQSACGYYQSSLPIINGPIEYQSRVIGWRLKRIFSNIDENGEVEINSNFPSPDVTGYKLISNILVKDRYQNQVERIEFNYDLYQNTKRVFLDKVAFQDTTKHYHFNYIQPQSLPERLTKGQDHWGYYNGADNNVHYFPDIPDYVYFSGIGGANKEPNGTFSKIGLLERITYPTKGKSEIFYEPNTYYGLKHIPGQTDHLGLAVERHGEGCEPKCLDSINIQSLGAQYITIFVNVEEIVQPDSDLCFESTGKARAMFQVIDDSSGLVVPLLVKSVTLGLVFRDGCIFTPNGGIDNNCYAYLLPGRQYTLILQAMHFCMTASANVKYLIVAPHDTNLNVETGGQRIQKLVKHDPISDKDETLRYYYYKKDNPLESSGITGQKGMYISSAVNQIQCSQNVQEPLYYRVLSASSLCPLFNTNNNNVYYTDVIVSHGGDSFENGGESHEFLENTDYRGEVLQGDEILTTSWTNFGWMKGLEKKSTIFKLNANGDKISLMETNNEYFCDTQRYYNYVVGYAVRKKYNNLISGPTNIENLDITKYKNISFWTYLKSTTINQYDENGANPISTTTNFFYDNIYHLQLTRSETKKSNGDSTRTKLYFPNDITQFPCKDKLLSQHRIAENVIEEKYVKSPNHNWEKISTQKATFKDWGNDIIHPWLVELSTYNNTLKTRARFYNIDNTNSNPLEFSKEDGVHTSYFWAYQKTKPVVEAINVSSSDLIAAVNFTNSNLDQLLSPTGIGDLTTPSQRNSWKTFNSTLRSQPLLKDAMVTTFTYKPLIGITSSTDPGGITTYYEYDSFGRLHFIRDNEYNIVKKNDYHFANE